jgi:hypothetical protein
LRREEAGLKFGFAVHEGCRWQDEGQGNTAVKQYQFSRKVVQLAEAIGHNSVYAYDHFFPSFKRNHKKNFFECYTLISAIADAESGKERMKRQNTSKKE